MTPTATKSGAFVYETQSEYKCNLEIELKKGGYNLKSIFFCLQYKELYNNPHSIKLQILKYSFHLAVRYLIEGQPAKRDIS